MRNRKPNRYRCNREHTGTSIRCPRCGGRLTLIALIEDPVVIARFLRHLGLPHTIPEARPARPPPLSPCSADLRQNRRPPLRRASRTPPDPWCILARGARQSPRCFLRRARHLLHHRRASSRRSPCPRVLPPRSPNPALISIEAEMDEGHGTAWLLAPNQRASHEGVEVRTNALGCRDEEVEESPRRGGRRCS